MDAACELKALRERAGLNLEKMANALGLNKASGYQYYEKAPKFSKEFYPLDMVERMIPALEGKGEPPIGAEEVLRLSGLDRNKLMELYLISLRDAKGVSELSNRVVALSVRVPVLTSITAGTVMNIENMQLEECKAVYVDDGVMPGAIAIQIQDDAMLPMIPSGTIVVAHPKAKYSPGSIVVTEIDGESLCRKIRMTNDGGVEFAPTNGDYRSYKFTADDAPRTIYKAVRMIRDISTL